MTGRRALVTLGDLLVGRLIEGDDAGIEFRVDRDYLEMPRRPVLGQWFEDRQRPVQRGDRPGDLPAFFANLIPEGDLRLTIQDRLGVPSGDDFGLLCAVGGDLPGALVVEMEAGEAPPRPASVDAGPGDGGLRFSLAGVQLKFSMVRGSERFHMPGRDERGSWIAKISYDAYPDLGSNEWVTMEWARRMGFDVPATELRPLTDLVDAPFVGAADAQAFLIRRYDRLDGGARVHQEDFQQIVGRRPEKKYDDMTYDKLAFLADRLVEGGCHVELIRRLAFMIASGNSDAHMKNWSVIYPDGISARLSPLYDQVFTARWPKFAREMSLKVDGTKEFAVVDTQHFRELARRIRFDEEATVRVVTETVARAAGAWADLSAHPNVTDAYRDALQRHWRKVPLLRGHALLV